MEGTTNLISTLIANSKEFLQAAVDAGTTIMQSEYVVFMLSVFVAGISVSLISKAVHKLRG